MDFLRDTGGRIMQTTDGLSIEETERWRYLGQWHLCLRNSEDKLNTVVPTFFWLWLF